MKPPSPDNQSPDKPATRDDSTNEPPQEAPGNSIDPDRPQDHTSAVKTSSIDTPRRQQSILVEISESSTNPPTVAKPSTPEKRYVYIVQELYAPGWDENRPWNPRMLCAFDSLEAAIKYIEICVLRLEAATKAPSPQTDADQTEQEAVGANMQEADDVHMVATQQEGKPADESVDESQEPRFAGRYGGTEIRDWGKPHWTVHWDGYTRFWVDEAEVLSEVADAPHWDLDDFYP
jgi:hypothetical protein